MAKEARTHKRCEKHLIAAVLAGIQGICKVRDLRKDDRPDDDPVFYLRRSARAQLFDFPRND